MKTQAGSSEACVAERVMASIDPRPIASTIYDLRARRASDARIRRRRETLGTREGRWQISGNYARQMRRKLGLIEEGNCATRGR